LFLIYFILDIFKLALSVDVSLLNYLRHFLARAVFSAARFHAYATPGGSDEPVMVSGSVFYNTVVLA
jgi:hypothetical protein